MKKKKKKKKKGEYFEFNFFRRSEKNRERVENVCHTPQ